MVKKKARDDVRCQLKQRHRQTPKPKIEQPTPHAEAYIASPLAAGDEKYKHSEGASGCLNILGFKKLAIFCSRN